MADNSTIEWTDTTWNPIAGCSIVSPGCTNCYAMRRVAPRLSGNPATPHYHGTVMPSKAGPVWSGKIGIASDAVLLKPLRWKRGRRIFVNSTSDLFHEDVPDEVIDKVFAVMALTPQHTYQVLTKRADRMRDYLGCIQDNPPRRTHIMALASRMMKPDDPRQREGAPYFPLPNVWLGVSVEDQTRADERIPHLLATPAAVRFISAEPLLGPVDLTAVNWIGGRKLDVLQSYTSVPQPEDGHWQHAPNDFPHIDWVIVGGESGNGARPMHPDWARHLRDQCASADVPLFVKQWGEWLPISQMSDDDTLYHPAPESDPEASRRCKVDTICLDAAGKRWSLGKANQYHQIEDGAFSTGGSMMMFNIGKHAAGRLLDGVEHNAFPQERRT